MTAAWTPMRWPKAWKDPSSLALLKGTAVNCLLVDRSDDLGPIVTAARQQGLTVADAAALPAGIAVIDGDWTGVKLTRAGATDTAAAGPTGNPWIDSNGWKIRLAAALQPGKGIWVAATPEEGRLLPSSYVTAVADAAAHGGRWILELDDRLASGIAGRNAEALATWSQLTGAAGFFAAHNSWSDFLPEALLGVISDFSGSNELLGQELLNLSARTNLPYRILLKAKVSSSSLQGLRAVLYADAEPPAPDVRKQILAFVQSGGLLITGPSWGPLPGQPASNDQYPGYVWRTLGQGKVAAAPAEFDDPYAVVTDAVLLISHRHDLLRFWNGGAVGSYFTMDAGRKLAVAHLLFYSTSRNSSAPTVRVAGKYRTARMWTLDQPNPQSIDMELQPDAVELRLPLVSPYAAIELEVRT
jgi:hypothetical protein